MDVAFDDDTHICLKCQGTFVGLDSYVHHRRTKCNPGTPPPLSLVSSPRLCEEKSLRMSPENSPSKAQDFFSSLELRSSSKNRLDDFDIDFDLPSMPKQNLDLPSGSSSKYNFVRDLDLETNFGEQIDLELNKHRKNNYESLDLEHENLINDPSLISIDNRSRSILDSDIFSTGNIEKVISCAIEAPTNYLVPPPSHTSGKWMPGKSGYRKYGSGVHYFCRTCNRRLSSRLLYEKHLRSELHFKRKAESSVYDMEEVQCPGREKRVTAGTRIVPPRNAHIATLNNNKTAQRTEKQINPTPKKSTRMKRTGGVRVIHCGVCKVKVPCHLMGKHLVSHFHCRRASLRPGIANDLILENMDRIVRHSPFQCALCRFYCNSGEALCQHWISDMHKKNDKKHEGLYWCQQCKAEASNTDTMLLHLISEEHEDTAETLNHTVPIVVRKRTFVKCVHCEETFALKVQLVHHLRRRHGLYCKPEATFNCTLCEFSSARQRALQRHIIHKHTSETKLQYFCGSCERTFSNQAKCLEHRRLLQCRLRRARLRGRDVRRRCTLCGELFPDLVHLKTHIFATHAGALHSCNKCGKKFAISQDLSRHVRDGNCVIISTLARTIPNKKMFFCDQCEKSFTRRRNLANHCLRFHAPPIIEEAEDVFIPFSIPTPRREPVLYECEMCNFRTPKKCFVLRHMTSIHFPDTRKRDWACETCNKAFFDKYSLRQHEKLHFPKQFQCSEVDCFFASRYQSELSRHVASVHSEERHFPCRQCSYQAKTKFQLKKHAVVHQDNKAHKCPHCKMRFSLNSHLRRHVRLHTGSKPYQCPYCEYNCNTLENLRKHILVTKKHEGKKMYSCKLCTEANVADVFSTNSANEFRTHLHRHHRSQGNALSLGTRNILAYVHGICDDFVTMAERENYKTRTVMSLPPSTSSAERITTSLTTSKQSKTTSARHEAKKKTNLLIHRLTTENDYNIHEYLNSKIDFPSEPISPGTKLDDPVTVNAFASDSLCRFESSDDIKRSLNVPMVEITPDYEIQMDIEENGAPCVVFIPACDDDQTVIPSRINYDRNIIDIDSFQNIINQDANVFVASIDDDFM